MKISSIQNPQLFEVSLKILLRNNKNEYLLLKTGKDGSLFAGKFDLPGGRINKGELNLPFEKLIRREVSEEAGGGIRYKLRQDPVSLCMYKYPGEISRFFILFEAKYISGDVVISDEHIGYEWKKLKKVEIKKIFPKVIHKLIMNYLEWNNAR